ncbi:hypothetical protein HMPREF9154_0300 [Arachnia propionica F0230a]|nr:hypothetical protein HMPREF9154_0300 [Arachnia propionica F0230a]
MTGHRFFPWGVGIGQGSGLQDYFRTVRGFSPSGPGWR